MFLANQYKSLFSLHIFFLFESWFRWSDMWKSSYYREKLSFSILNSAYAYAYTQCDCILERTAYFVTLSSFFDRIFVFSWSAVARVKWKSKNRCFDLLSPDKSSPMCWLILWRVFEFVAFSSMTFYVDCWLLDVFALSTSSAFPDNRWISKRLRKKGDLYLEYMTRHKRTFICATIRLSVVISSVFLSPSLLFRCAIAKIMWM